MWKCLLQASMRLGFDKLNVWNISRFFLFLFILYIFLSLSLSFILELALAFALDLFRPVSSRNDLQSARQPKKRYTIIDDAKYLKYYEQSWKSQIKLKITLPFILLGNKLAKRLCLKCYGKWKPSTKLEATTLHVSHFLHISHGTKAKNQRKRYVIAKFLVKFFCTKKINKETFHVNVTAKAFSTIKPNGAHWSMLRIGVAARCNKLIILLAIWY